MKHLIVMAFMFSIAGQLIAQPDHPEYDSILARSLGADDYGMKSYVFVILKTGPTVITEQTKKDSLFAGHMHNIQRMAAEGKLVVAGPFFENDHAYRGLFILNVTSFEEARTLLSADPTILEKVFEVELYNWYGSAALGEYLKVHERIEKKRF
jgi:uncharacterized protein